MNIDPTSELSQVPMPQSPKAAPKGSEASSQPLPPSESSLEKTNEAEKQQSYVNKLADMPEVRPEVVEQGKKLAQDANYPSTNELDELAKVLTSPIATAE